MKVRTTRTLAVALVCLTSIGIRPMAGQTPAATTQTTKGRVYSAAQATRGKEQYTNMCLSCHPTATYKGAVFMNWQGRTLAELLDFLMEKMPKNDPGSLSSKEYMDVVAYLLKINNMPAGRTDLPDTPGVLKGITIDLLPGKTSPAGAR